MPELLFYIIPSIALVGTTIYFFWPYLKGRLSTWPSRQSDQHPLQTLSPEKSYETLHQAIKKAQDILTQAELEEIKIVASSKIETQRLGEKVEQELNQTSSQTKQALEKQLQDFSLQLKQAQEEYLNYLKGLKTTSNELHENTLEVVKQEVNKLFVDFEQKLSEFLSQTEQKSTQSIELELAGTRQLIDTYKQQQLKIIDENVVAMLERTLSLVLPQKLSLKEQVDLIYEALEKAKMEKFII